MQHVLGKNSQLSLKVICKLLLNEVPEVLSKLIFFRVRHSTIQATDAG